MTAATTQVAQWRQIPWVFECRICGRLFRTMGRYPRRCGQQQLYRMEKRLYQNASTFYRSPDMTRYVTS
jgi:hypothetical protein